MRLTRRRLGWLALILILLVGTVTASTSSKARWRAQIVGMKLAGSLGDMTWSEVLEVLRRSKSFDVAELLDSGNPYAARRNLHDSDLDVAEGKRLFVARCAACHGVDARGATGPDLVEGSLRRGGSDRSLFRTLTSGIPGTAMPAAELSERERWQVVAFLQTLRGGRRDAAVDAVAEPTAVSRSAPVVTYARLRGAEHEPGSWLTYSGTYDGRRFSALDQIRHDNLDRLRLVWTYQALSSEPKFETTPLVIGDVLYLTEPTNHVVALEAATGRVLWRYERDLPSRLVVCCGLVNHGLAALGDRLYLGTLDARLVALDAASGAVVWEVQVADFRKGYSITAAPLAVKDKIVVGVAGGEYGIRGFLDAYNGETGAREWRFYTVPGPGEPGHDTWSGDSWKTGGGGTWMTGAFDPELNLVYWGVGNPAALHNGEHRRGDNLYTNSVIALDADRGTLRWHFQFTPHDLHDWDATQVPVLLDQPFGGSPRRLLAWANRNAFFYLLDRESGEFLLAREYAKQTWAEGIDPRGRPIVRPGTSPTPEGTLVYPASQGATNWWSPSYHPRTDLLYVPVQERASIYFTGLVEYRPGQLFTGGGIKRPAKEELVAFVRAIRPTTGETVWEHRLPDRPPTVLNLGGILSTAGDVVFAGAADLFVALHAESGTRLWEFRTGGAINAAPISYVSGGRQHVSIAAGRSVFTFALDGR